MELEDNGIGDVIEMRGSVEAGPFLIGWTKDSYRKRQILRLPLNLTPLL